MRIRGKVFVGEIEKTQKCNILKIERGRATVVTKHRTLLNRIVKYEDFKKDGCVYIEKQKEV